MNVLLSINREAKMGKLLFVFATAAGTPLIGDGEKEVAKRCLGGVEYSITPVATTAVAAAAAAARWVRAICGKES